MKPPHDVPLYPKTSTHNTPQHRNSTYSSISLLLPDVDSSFVDVDAADNTVEVFDNGDLTVVDVTQYISLASVVLLVPA